MKTTEDSTQRRSFFKYLLAGLAGGWMGRTVVRQILRSEAGKRTERNIHVAINPLAVPRTNEDAATHGT